MEQSNRRWIIRDASGQISGPFTTEKILYKIGRGEFSGEESIAHYPDGKWIPISQGMTKMDAPKKTAGALAIGCIDFVRREYVPQSASEASRLQHGVGRQFAPSFSIGIHRPN